MWHPSHYVTAGTHGGWVVMEIGKPDALMGTLNKSRAIDVATALEAGKPMPPLLTEADIKKNMKSLPPLPKKGELKAEPTKTKATTKKKTGARI
jgi:hypothetical protein